MLGGGGGGAVAGDKGEERLVFGATSLGGAQVEEGSERGNWERGLHGEEGGGG